MRSHTHGASPRLAGEYPTTSEIGEFWECWYIARGDSLAENRAM